MDNKQRYDWMVEAIKADIPGFEIKFKDKNLVSKLIGMLVWVFNRTYMTKYTTTRGGNVYFPSREFVSYSYLNAWKILAHEWVHLHDRKEQGIWFELGFLLPQLGAAISLLSLLSIWFSNWWLLDLLALVLAAPIPSPGRMKVELRAYAMSMAVNLWQYGYVKESTKEWIVKQFTGPNYYFMWPFKEDMKKRLDGAEEAIKTGEVMEWPGAKPFKAVQGMVQM